MPSLKGTKTEQNLKRAFACECQTHRRYLYFAQKALAQGYNGPANTFRRIAEAEAVHASRFLEFFDRGADPLVGVPIGTILENLKAAIAGEVQEHSQMYPEMARTAREEGFEEIAEFFDTVTEAERRHAEEFRRLLTSTST